MNDITLGDRIRLLRESKRLKQFELSKELNVTKQMMSFYENDKRQPDLNMIVKIALYFNVSTDYLLGITKRMNIQGDTMIQNLIAENEEVKDFLIEYITRLGKK